jgi:Protein of unknown function (DUF3592)
MSLDRGEWKHFLQTVLRRVVLLIGVFYCFHGAVLELRATRQYQQVAKWPFVQAYIHSSTVYRTSYSWSGKQDRYCPSLEYTYMVQGRTYNGSNRVFDFVCWPDAYGFVAQHQPGALINIAYDPANPTVSIVPDAVRNPGYPWGDIIGGILFAVILLADLLGAWTA